MDSGKSGENPWGKIGRGPKTVGTLETPEPA